MSEFRVVVAFNAGREGDIPIYACGSACGMSQPLNLTKSRRSVQTAQSARLYNIKCRSYQRKEIRTREMVCKNSSASRSYMNSSNAPLQTASASAGTTRIFCTVSRCVSKA